MEMCNIQPYSGNPYSGNPYGILPDMRSGTGGSVILAITSSLPFHSLPRFLFLPSFTLQRWDRSRSGVSIEITVAHTSMIQTNECEIPTLVLCYGAPPAVGTGLIVLSVLL